MRWSRTAWGVVAVIVLALAVAGAAGAAKKARDQVWVRPDFATLRVGRIAFLPVTSYDNNIQTENSVEASLGPAFKGIGYRWLSGTTTRELLRSKTGGDSLLKTLRAGVLAQGRLDSLHAPGLASMLRCDAVLTVRVDQYDRHEPEWNVAGKSYTTVQLRSALVDSSGRLLWTASGTQTGEGSYYDPNTNPVAVSDKGLERKLVSGQAGAPPFGEVLALLSVRWATLFPAPPAAAADSAVAPR